MRARIRKTVNAGAMVPTQAKSLRIIQLSDCHVSANPAALFRGQGAGTNLQRVLDLAGRWKPDLLLLTGDVSEDGSQESYERTSNCLAQTGVPILALPGNHDDVDLMSHYFPLGPWSRPYVLERSNWQLVLLDSTEAERISGRFSETASKQLHTALQDGGQEHALVALHHQPVPVGAPWIDRYMLESPQRFFEVIDRSSRVRCICWGHVHHDVQLRRKGVTLLGAPSTVANSIAATQRFTLDPAGPAYRWLTLSARGEVETGVHYAG